MKEGEWDLEHKTIYASQTHSSRLKKKKLLFKDTDVPIPYLKAIVRNSILDRHVTGVKLEVLSEESQKRVRFEAE